jgi:hypothetical protein
MTPPGFVVLGIRRAFRANPGRELTTRELWSWTHPTTRCAPGPCRKTKSMLNLPTSRQAGGVQDVAGAWVAYREASRTGIGVRFDLSGDGSEY